MLDWDSAFPYLLISVIILFCIGIYALISAKKFIRLVFAVELLFFSINLLLLSFGTANENRFYLSDSFAQTLSIFILIIGICFGVIGVAIDKRLRTSAGSTEIFFDFTFKTDSANLEDQNDLTQEETNQEKIRSR